MIDREKVIKGLECSIGIRGVKDCNNCPYDTDERCIGCDVVLLRDALELLKEQEAVTIQPHYTNTYGKCFICGVECGNCGNEIGATYKFCPYCGRAVKWE